MGVKSALKELSLIFQKFLGFNSSYLFTPLLSAPERGRRVFLERKSGIIKNMKKHYYKIGVSGRK
jgi:hypothetical protein